jgi:predicted lipoprotein with Yx(FWY)xxD motif
MLTQLTHKTRRTLLLTLLFALVAACGGGGGSTAASPVSTDSAPKPTTAVASATDAAFGSILTDSKGLTAYFFDDDKPIKPQSSCVGGCAKTWPPLLASEGTTVGTGLDQAKLGTVTRPDGLVQLTYNSWPLYRYLGDTTPGSTNGQGIDGKWHVAGANGKPVTAAQPAGAPSSSYGY